MAGGGLGRRHPAQCALETHRSGKWGLAPGPLCSGQKERDPDQRQEGKEPNGQELFPKL